MSEIKNVITEDWSGHSHGEVEDALKDKLAEMEQSIEDASSAGGYNPPTTGIPKSDFEQSVQDTLDSVANKVDKEQGKGLSSNDYTDADKDKVDNLKPVATSGSYNDLTDKPTIPAGSEVDPALSDMSENAVQNKVVKAAIDSLRNALDTLIGSGNVQGAIDTFNEVKAFLDGIDTSDPTLASQLLALNNAISALQTSLDAKANTANVYTKSEVDDLVADAGKVKSVSINDEEPVEPDGNGNVALTVTVREGKSAYDSYLETTTDNPKRDEADWVAHLKGEDGKDGVSLGEVAIVNNLKETTPGKVLDATQGKELNDELELRKFFQGKAYGVADCTITGGINSQTGADASASTYNRSDYVPLPNGVDKVLLSWNWSYSSFACLAFYDSSKAKISLVNGRTTTGQPSAAAPETREVSVPEGAAYIRLCSSMAEGAYTTVSWSRVAKSAEIVYDINAGGDFVGDTVRLPSAEQVKTLAGRVEAVAEMGETVDAILDATDVQEDKFQESVKTQGGVTNKPSEPIMYAGNTYTIEMQADLPITQTRFQLCAFDNDGTLSVITNLGSADLSEPQTVEYTPQVDIYQIGCPSGYYASSSGLTNPDSVITYTIRYGTFSTKAQRGVDNINKRLDDLEDTISSLDSIVGLDQVLDVGQVTVVDETVFRGSGNSGDAWPVFRDDVLLEAGKTYIITNKTDVSSVPTRWQLFVKKADGSLVYSNVGFINNTTIDLLDGWTVEYTPAYDVYGVGIAYAGDTATQLHWTIKTKSVDANRIKNIENDIRDNEKAMDAAGVNRYYGYYRLGAAGNDTYNIAPHPIGLIVMGQSNAAGRIPNTSFPATATVDSEGDLTLSKSLAHCQYMRGYNSDGSSTDQYDESTKEFLPRDNTVNWAFDDIVYNAIHAALGGNEDFYVLKQAKGDTGIVTTGANPWLTADIDKLRRRDNGQANSQLYHMKLLVERALSLQPNIHFRAVLWHQGEAENAISQAGVYYDALCKVIYWLRGLVGNPKLPFIFGTVPTGSGQYSAIVKADMERVAQEVNDCYLVDLGAGLDWVDSVHFGAQTATNFGVEVYKIMRQHYMLAPAILPVSNN